MIHRLAWKQLILEKRRLAAALAGIAFAVMLQMMQFGLRDALFDSAVIIHERLIADLILASPLYSNEVEAGTITRRPLYQALSEPAAESVTPLFLGIRPFKNPETGRESGIVVIGFDPSKHVLDIPAVVEQAHLLKVPDVALFDLRSQPEFGRVPELLRERGVVFTEIADRRTKIVGLFELGTSFAGSGHLIVSDQTFRNQFHRPEGIFELGLIKLKPGSDVAAVQASLKARLPQEVQVLTPAELIQVEKGYWQTATPIGFIFLMGSMIGLVVGAVIVYQILYTDVSDHLGEYATLKAMGYSDRQLYLVVLQQAVILSVLGSPIGFALAQGLYIGARAGSGLPIEMTVARLLMVFALTFTMCIASGFLALRKLQSADPADVF